MPVNQSDLVIVKVVEKKSLYAIVIVNIVRAGDIQYILAVGTILQQILAKLIYVLNAMSIVGMKKNLVRNVKAQKKINKKGVNNSESNYGISNGR